MSNNIILIKDEFEDLDNINSNNNSDANQDNFIMHKNTFNSKINNNFFNNKFSLNLKNRNSINILASSMKKPALPLNKIIKVIDKRNTSFSRTLRKPHFNYDEIINFNFGSKNPAKLKLINTKALTTNTPEKTNNQNISIKMKEKDKSSLFNKKKNIINKRKNKYALGYQWTKNFNEENEKNKNSNLSEHKSITNNNGILQLPLLSNILYNTKVKPKKNIYTDDDKDSLIKKYIEKKEYDKINDILDKDNEKMNKLIESKMKSLDEKVKKNNAKRPNEETQEGIEILYQKYNEKRGKKNNIITNRTLDIKNKKEDLINIHTLEEIEYYNKNKLNNILLDVKGNPRYLISIDDNKNKADEKLTEYELISLTNQANKKVEQLFPDLCTFHLPKILRKNKEYTIKLLYDVFIEFKTLLKCCMIHNRNLNIHKKGIDFETFYNCNTKINQQGIALSRKIFKAFNNKTNVNYMPWQNYMDGMMKIKDPNIDNKLDLFFQILDENGDGSFDYNEVYNLSLISLQRVLPEKKQSKNNSKKSEKDKENEEPDITNILAEFLTKYVFQLVGIDCDGEIPIDLLREKMDEKNEESEYLEFFLCADNFA